MDPVPAGRRVTEPSCALNLYTAAGGITLWHVIRFARPVCGVPARPSGDRHAQRRRKLAFVLAATNHGMMITNRFDYRMSGRSGGGLANDGIGGGRSDIAGGHGGIAGGTGGGVNDTVADVVDDVDGVGSHLLETATFDPVEVELALRVLEARRVNHGDGVVGVDGGANIGVHAIEWATAMTGWGSVTAMYA